VTGRRVAPVVAGAVALLVAAGCASAPATPPPQPALTVASTAAPSSLDVTASPTPGAAEVLDYNVYQHLVQLDPRGALVPVLATSDAVSADGLTYTFALRPHVSFSNGDPLTAYDVAFSLRRARTGSYPDGSLLADVASVRASGTSTVVVTLTHPDTRLLYDLAATSDGVVLDPPEVDDLDTSPIGTGPYRFVSQISGDDFVLARNLNYWGGRPQIGTVTFRYYPTATAEVAALRSGAAQVIDNLADGPDVHALGGGHGFEVVAGPGRVTVARSGVAGLPDSGRAVSFDLGAVRLGGTVPAAVVAEGYSA
jgi:peptide/nickel transport system substrate-binding protein